jgi:hypothetical protein
MPMTAKSRLSYGCRGGGGYAISACTAGVVVVAN